MGTNFYLNAKEDEGGIHIGKRSGAGPYCWDCNETLCKGGKKWIHYSQYEWFDKCPKCGKSREEESLSGTSAAGTELGFNKHSGKKIGVKSCCSFSWAIEDPVAFMLKLMSPKESKGMIIMDEYDRKISVKDFKKVILEDCPVKYYSTVGEEFS